jgi:riboflavin kinase/FMN adenylyltransferase
MTVFRSLAEMPFGFGPSVAAVGNFDGVHLGHRAILSALVADARSRNANAVAVTFDPHPDYVLRPSQAPPMITPIGERLRLLGETGIDAALVLPFDAALARLTPREFVERILVGALGVRSVHEGASFRFGHRAAAGVEELATFGKEFNFDVRVHESVQVRGLEVSSSAIRALIAAGDVRRARWMLGRPFAVLSPPARGRGLGSKLVVPTVNLAPYDGLLPALGVYVTRITIDGRVFESVTNVGNRPTFGEPSFAVETHILNFEPLAIDQNTSRKDTPQEETPLELQFLLRLRSEIKFPSPEALRAQIQRDVARAQKYFRRAFHC